MNNQAIYEAIDAAVADLSAYAPIYAAHSGAWQNAEDTVYVERAAPEGAWADIYVCSLVGLLANVDDADVLAFFAKFGVRP